jgi:ubiquinone/menaquinone biosynthesis C-methylase UbiE
MKKKYNQCYDVSEKNVRYLNLSIKRSKGQLPDLEVAKAYSKIISKIKLINNFSILDVGCLTGHFYRTFKKKIKKNFYYTGIDPWTNHINAAKKIWKNDKNINFKLGWAQNIPYKKNQFDVVVCSNVLTHIPEIRKPLREMLRVTKKYLILRTPVHNKSYRIQMVLNSKWFKFTNVPPKNEFDSKGNPRVYEYFDVHSKDFLTSVIKKITPKAKVRFIRDTFFSSKNIMNKKENKLAGTQVVKGMQVADLLILPHYFVIIEKN